MFQHTFPPSSTPGTYTGANLLPVDAFHLGVRQLASVKPDTPTSEPVISIDSEVTAGSSSTVDTKSTQRESTADVISTMYAYTQQETGLIINVSSVSPVKFQKSVGQLCSSPLSQNTILVKMPSL